MKKISFTLIIAMITGMVSLHSPAMAQENPVRSQNTEQHRDDSNNNYAWVGLLGLIGLAGLLKRNKDVRDVRETIVPTSR